MSAKVLPMDGDAHRGVPALLPWYASGRLDADEHALVEAHLAGCAHCRAELAWEHQLRAIQRAPDVEVGDVERSLAVVHRRLAAHDRAAPATDRAGTRASWLHAHRESWWWRWALAAQFAINVALGAWLLWPPVATYHALGSPAPSDAANVIVRFRADATEAEIRRALRQADAHVVGGPTATDAYLLRVKPERQLGAVAGLRAQPAVLLAESLGVGTSP
jgi:anti-sigma factor RsiW